VGSPPRDSATPEKKLFLGPRIYICIYKSLWKIPLRPGPQLNKFLGPGPRAQVGFDGFYVAAVSHRP
jgi:hypothetical protein